MKKVFFIIIVIIILIGTSVIFFLLQLQPTKIPDVQIPIMPTRPVFIQPTPPEVESVEPLKKFEIIQNLPYSSENYVIEYLSIPDVFIITIRNGPVGVVRQQALSWFTSQGVDPNGLNIQYNIRRYLQ